MALLDQFRHAALAELFKGPEALIIVPKPHAARPAKSPASGTAAQGGSERSEGSQPAAPELRKALPAPVPGSPAALPLPAA